VRWRLIGGSGLVALYTMFALFHMGWYVSLLGEQRYYRSDALHLYAAAQIVMDGKGSRLYDIDLQQRYQAAMPKRFSELLPFNHPPYTAALIAPLARFPFLVLYLLFSLGQLAAYAFAIWMLHPWWGRWSRTEKTFFLVIASTFVCVFHAVHWANPALFVFLLVVLAFRSSYRKPSAVSSGIWLALSTIKPHMVIGLFWAFVCGRRWRPLFSATLTLGALIGLAITVVGVEGTLSFGQTALSTYRAGETGRFGIKPENMPNFRGLLALTDLSNSGVASGSLAFVAAVALFLFWLWRSRPKDTDPASESLRWAVTIPLVLLASPHLYGQDVSLAVFSGMLLYDAARNLSFQRRMVGVFVLIAPLASQICFFLAGRFGKVPWNPWPPCNAIILLVLAFLALVVMISIKYPRSSEVAGPLKMGAISTVVRPVPHASARPKQNIPKHAVAIRRSDYAACDSQEALVPPAMF